MVFSSPIFLLFFLPLVLVVYYNPFFKGRSFRNHVLLLFSLVFYAWGEPLFVFIMMLSILLNWFFVLGMDRQKDPVKRRIWMLAPIIFDISLLFLFKYLGFFAHNLGLLMGSPISLDIALPIGISFFTFQIMSYVLDVYRRKAPVQNNVLRLGLYISLFPQLIAGPIVRYETVADEINERHENREEFIQGMTRFIFGLGKKVLLANYVGLIADNLFALGKLSVASAWLGVTAYALQIYYDFSGYSDMAIGMGRMFGFHFLENFNFPYTARSVTDFWRRWHISLSTWFRDYVYIPLGGNRVGAARQAFNLLAVWVLTGLWHGANWTFIIWGLYYFAFLLLEKFSGLDKKIGILSHVYTLVIVLVGWVIFRSDTLGGAMDYLGYMFGAGTTGVVDEVFYYYLSNGRWVLLAALLCTIPIVQGLRNRLALKFQQGGWLKVMDLGRTIMTAIIFVLSLLACVNSTYNPFIYFNF